MSEPLFSLELVAPVPSLDVPFHDLAAILMEHLEVDALGAVIRSLCWVFELDFALVELLHKSICGYPPSLFGGVSIALSANRVFTAEGR